MPVKNIIPGQSISKGKRLSALEFRHNLTDAEKILWEELRRNKLGVHFRRQQIVAGFIVDFYCHRSALVIELDGKIHIRQKSEDARRDQVLRKMGLHVLHIRNEEVQRDLTGVLKTISDLIGVT